MAKWLAWIVVAGAGGTLLGGCGTSAAQGTSSSSAAVKLDPSSGATNGRPTWSTSTACASGFQGSAVFREVHSDGTTTNSISPAVNGTTTPFHGTLQASIAEIRSIGGFRNGVTQKLVVICFSGPSLTGNSDREMTTYITYSADGTTYTTSGTP
ncbi:MAG: hypothetical protein JO345_14740 [Streptosporangiaceae bacterium]|nr:hypothetical protein [Streptosporangiaceae bacterium]